MQGSPISKMGAAAPGVVFGIRRQGDVAAANAAGGILMVDQVALLLLTTTIVYGVTRISRVNCSDKNTGLSVII